MVGIENWLDLHMHSWHSGDGEFSPAELMRRCAAVGIRSAALADHNTMQGTMEAADAAQQMGLRSFPAVELDCTQEGRNFHLLGYGQSPHAAAVRKIAEAVHEQELAASEQLLCKVRNIGFQFDEAVVRRKARNGVVAAEMIAEVVLADSRNAENALLRPFRCGGTRSDNPPVNFYWDFCAQGKPAYVPMQYISLSEAVTTIQEAGGAAILAHPGANIGQDRAVMETLIPQGLDGVEAYSNYHDSATQDFYVELARKHHLLVTAGSDFHGKAKPAIQLGTMHCPYPEEKQDDLMALIARRGGVVF